MSPRRSADTAVHDTPTRERLADRFLEIDIAAIDDSPFNPRRLVDASDLVDSIREKGIIQSLTVRPAKGDRFQVVAGSRRLAAARIVALARTFCVVKDLTDDEALEHALTENVKRRDMNPIDEAEGYAKLQRDDKRVYTVAAIARRIGQPESHIYRRLKLLELDATLRTALAEDRLSIGHAEKLLRLPVALRKQAADPENGVVWSHSPLLDGRAKWIPGREDLRPLADLEEFIRDKSHFDPTSEDTRHLQPELAAQIDAAVEPVGHGDTTEGEVDREESEARATIIEISEDPMARWRMGVSKSDRIPLTPSKWREVKSASARCAFTQRAVVTHGGPARVVEVCIKRSCSKHWPVNKKTTRKTAAAAKASGRPSWQIEQERREAADKAAQAAWAPIKPHAEKALVAHLRRFPLTAALVRAVARRSAISDYAIGRVEKDFGVALTDKTIALVFALTTVLNCDTREEFLRDVKPWKFNLGPIEQKVKAEAKKAAALAVKKGKAA